MRKRLDRLGRATIACVLAATTVTFGVSQVAQAADTGTISGTVTDASTGLPLSDFPVNLLTFQVRHDFDGSEIYGWMSTYPFGATTDSNGDYTITAVPPSDSHGYRVCFGTWIGPSTDYWAQCYNDQRGFNPNADAFGMLDVPDTAQPINLASGQAVTGINAHMDRIPPYHLSGRISDSMSSQVTGVKVDVFNASAPLGLVASAQGIYNYIDFRFDSPGPYLVCFDASAATSSNAPNGYFDQCHQDMPWSASDTPATGATPITLVAHADYWLPENLTPAAGIAGVVGEAGLGLKLSGVHVYALTASGTVLGSAVTDRKGAYHVTRLHPGTNFVCFDASAAKGGVTLNGYQSRCFGNVAWKGPGTAPPSGSRTVTTTAPATSTVNIAINATL